MNTTNSFKISGLKYGGYAHTGGRQRKSGEHGKGSAMKGRAMAGSLRRNLNRLSMP
jgi:hypothetical protein